ncbi:MAG: hypothetical protein GXY41_10215 [Phycisphaerae bacterium]|nr:hypothetical protein [Phycisphaerae bacterium]
MKTQIETKARQILEDYKARRFSGSRRPYRTGVEAAGVELDAVKCYLRGLTIAETVQYLKTDCGANVTKSAIARFFRDLFINNVRY